MSGGVEILRSQESASGVAIGRETVSEATSQSQKKSGLKPCVALPALPAAERPTLPGPPSRPTPLREKLAGGLFRALSPRLKSVELPEIPDRMAPYEVFGIPRATNPGHLAATWFPADRRAVGAVLMAHPWTPWGQAYFHRRRRVEALRVAGYHVLTFDFGGVGASGPIPQGFHDCDLRDALVVLKQRAGALPLHLWGVSFGGYWAHPVLARESWVAGAFFEDVSPHLLEWSGRMAPLGWPFYRFMQHAFPSAYQYFDLRRHAPHLRTEAVAYVSGREDPGVLAQETEHLAQLAGGESLVVEGAGHLEAIRKAGDTVIDFALATFKRAIEREGEHVLLTFPGIDKSRPNPRRFR